jgi:alpha-beta hydrolase superfamily lysophospholipase
MIDPAAGNAESRFVAAGDGVRLHYLRWRSERSPPSTVVVFLHGIASHAGWFAETAADLNRHGVEVYGLDRRGSGRSGGPRGHLDRYERALDDVEQLVRLLAADHPDTPVFLAASSWAAKLGVVYAAQRAAPLSGLLLLGPGLFPRVNLSPWRLIVVVLVVFIVQTIAGSIANDEANATPLYIGNVACADLEPLWLEAQSVPSASMVPCLQFLPVGWTLSKVTSTMANRCSR